MEQIIARVDRGGLGEYLGLEPGDTLLSIDGHEIEDVLDYYYYTSEPTFTFCLRTKQGEEVEVPVERYPGAELGLHFEEEFMGKYRHCSNHCMFCFIDQLPKGLRAPLYFKDDDARLSFLNGNYITLTNMSEADMEKVIRYHLSPMNVSVHTTNPDLRVRMLKNPAAARIMEGLTRFKEAGIEMNGQIVLCKGVNDGDELYRTVHELAAFWPEFRSLSIVPVGLTRYRQDLERLEPFTADDAEALIQTVSLWQREFLERGMNHFVHLADEFYSLAGRALPKAESYDGYLQIENGVGMLRSMQDEVRAALRSEHKNVFRTGRFALVSAPCAYPYIQELVDEIAEKAPNRRFEVLELKNRFFGEHITVTGLLTGGDIIDQVRQASVERGHFDKILIPENCTRGGQKDPVFLDDMTVSDVHAALQMPVFIVKSTGEAFVKALLS